MSAPNVSGVNSGPNSSKALNLVPVQYAPDSNQTYIQGGPLSISSSVSQAFANLPGFSNVQQVMASPPTVAISTTNPVATGQQYAVAGASVIDLSNFTITGCGNAVIAGTVSPDNGLVSFNSVTANNGTNQNGSNVIRVSVIYNSVQAAPAIAFVLKGLTGNITAKVNDKYVSLTPTAVPNNGALNYYSLTFAAAGTYRIDVIIDNVLNSGRFGGCWTVSKTDTVYPAPIRGGKRIVVVGDSVTSATGGGNQSAGFVQCFAEYMGYDDVWPAGIGGTGLLNSGSGSLTYIQRVQQDAIAFKPDEIIIQGFYNDGSNTSIQVQTALVTLVQAIQQALPACRISILGPYAPTGVSFQGGTNQPGSIAFPGQRAALQNVIATINSPLVKLLDPTTLPFFSSSEFSETPATYTLTASSAANASSLSISAGLLAGAHYQFADTSRFRCLSSTGVTATVENSPNAQANGAYFAQCGSSWLSGNGKAGATTGIGNADNYIIADGIHPSALGHLNLGLTTARLYVLAWSGEG